ncbi:Prostaglandin E synthase 3 (Cytosolic) [Orbilia brochopaga]|uniref:Prostaglandin E synthase 3 (Cytosolic) n=1 Tax=Orbilia brochopaga TaxID=3140254 RepID=A0AAV9UXM2_9PEZI
MATLHPEVTWAQRSSPVDADKNIIYLTIKAPDVSKDNLKLDLTSTKLSYKGKTDKGQEYGVEIEFFEEIDPTESRHHHSARATECVLRKKEKKEEFWPRLTKDKAKLHWLKTDFDKWVDEDEQDGPAPEPEFDPSMMSQFGGGDDAGGFGGIDFSKLGGAQDLSGLGGNATGLDDDSDDDMPDLEGDKEKEGDGAAAIPSEPTAAAPEKGKAVIEELD